MAFQGKFTYYSVGSAKGPVEDSMKGSTKGSMKGSMKGPVEDSKKDAAQDFLLSKSSNANPLERLKVVFPFLLLWKSVW